MLESMQERKVSIGGEDHNLPDPFFVLATQNPIEQEGTYPLPEAQLDRFMFMIKVEYPNEEEEFEIMKAYTAANFTANTSSMASRAGTAVGNVDGLVMSAGGSIISVGGTNYGAVGVSGAPSGKTDEECANAGIKAVVEDLEMAD